MSYTPPPPPPPLWFYQKSSTDLFKGEPLEIHRKKKVANSMWPKLPGLIGQKQQNSFQQTHMENFFVSIRRLSIISIVHPFEHDDQS